MATKKLQQSQLELQAGQSGESATQRSHESLVNTRHRNADRAEGARQSDNSNEQRSLDRWQRQWEQQRAARSQRDTQRAANQAQKPRTTNFGGEGYLEGQEPKPTGDARLDETRRQFDASQQQQQGQFEQRQAQDQQQFDTRTDLQAATQGLQRSGQPGSPADNPRLQALQEEMQKRQKQQMGAGLEQTGRRGFVPTPEEQAKQARAANLAERDMQTKELNAAANYQRAATAYERIGVEIKAAKTKEQKAELQAKQKDQEKSLLQPIKSSAGRLDRFMKGDHTQADMQTLQALVNSQVAPVGSARPLHDEVAAGQIGPRVTQFLTEQVAAQAIEFIYATGKLPDGDLVDFGSAGMQEFSRRALEARQLLMPNTVAGQMLNREDVSKIKRGYADHLEMVNKLAALLVMKQQPSTSGPGAALGKPQEPTHEQRRADPSQPQRPGERYGQITPDEAGRRAVAAGGTAAPKTSKQPYRPDPHRSSYDDVPGLPTARGYQ